MKNIVWILCIFSACSIFSDTSNMRIDHFNNKMEKFEGMNINVDNFDDKQVGDKKNSVIETENSKSKILDTNNFLGEDEIESIIQEFNSGIYEYRRGSNIEIIDIQESLKASYNNEIIRPTFNQDKKKSIEKFIQDKIVEYFKNKFLEDFKEIVFNDSTNYEKTISKQQESVDKTDFEFLNCPNFILNDHDDFYENVYISFICTNEHIYLILDTYYFFYTKQSKPKEHSFTSIDFNEENTFFYNKLRASLKAYLNN